MSYLQLGYHTWREDLRRYKIGVLEPDEVIPKAQEHNVLLVTNCSKTKGKSGVEEVPKNFYVSKQNLRFYEWCDQHGFEYGVLSDIYGLHLWDEKLSFYDHHPSKLDKKQYRHLASEIYFKMDKLDRDTFLYYGLPPVNCRPYFYMMIITGLKIFYTTKLTEK